VNTVFRIAFGDYELALDRTALTYSLTETVTGTVWATQLPVGWIELAERESGTITRHDFSDCKLVSVAEKMGASGKRLLLGLDAPGGIPLDLYFICGSKEIQLTVEASRDSKTHTLHQIGLLPELAAVNEEGESLFWPTGDDQWEERLDHAFAHEATGRVWGALQMPMIGAIRRESALALLTDSAYATAQVTRSECGLSFTWQYQRDPERRRLDLRLILLPHGDAVSLCKAYRDKLVGERQHKTLRMRMRERPEREALLGAVFVRLDFPQKNPPLDAVLALAQQAQENLEGHTRFCSLPYGLAHDEQIALISELTRHGWRVFGEHRIGEEPKPGLTAVGVNAYSWLSPDRSRWDQIDEAVGAMGQLQEASLLVGSYPRDWNAISSDFWYGDLALSHAVVWRDAVPGFTYFAPTHFAEAFRSYSSLLWHLLYLTRPYFLVSLRTTESDWLYVKAAAALLCPLNQLTFAAFLKSQRFLTADQGAQETVFTDGTRVVINLRRDPYETDELLLPPGGFYVNHAQLEAHDALRVGMQEFSSRAWRMRHSLDGTPLEQLAFQAIFTPL